MNKEHDQKHKQEKGTLRNQIFTNTNLVHMNPQTGEFTYTERNFPVRPSTNLEINKTFGIPPWRVKHEESD